MVTLKGITVKLVQPTLPSPLEPSDLARRLLCFGSLKHLTVPFAFFREGMIDFEFLRYANAFRNFYFCLEGLFGNGKTKNKDVEREFLDSPILMRSVTAVLENLDRASPMYSQIVAHFQNGVHSLGAEGIINYFVRTRGVANHYSMKSTLKHGHPLNHREFYVPAYLGLVTCFYAYASCIEEHNNRMVQAAASNST